MTWYAVYQAADGRLVSGTDDPEKLADQPILTASGYVVAQLPDGSQTGVWNTTTHQFDPAPPAPALLDRVSFMLRFTQAERIAIRASADPVVVDFMDLLTHATQVDLRNPETQAGVNYLGSTNPPLLAAGRATTILTR